VTTNQGRSRRLESEASVAARSPLAQHEDALSPARSVREASGAGESQRLGDGLPVAGPVTTFPDDDASDDPIGGS
jgi:hypothetical protein